MKKLAIVSSYNELCGNATYTEVLKNEFSKYYDVEVLPLKVKWLGSSNKTIRKLADEHIRSLAKQLEEYDCVNIQFEAGLYGSHPDDIIRRIKVLADSSKNLVFTMHRVDVVQSFFDKKTLKGFLSKNIVGNLKNLWRINYFPRVYRDIIKYLKVSSKRKNVQIIVHTRRDRETVQYIYQFENAHDFPLSFLNKAQLDKYKQGNDRGKFCAKYAVKESDKIIGLFGFIADYKAHDTVIKALKLLPEDYKILIFGSQHPMSIMSYEKINPYINTLMKLIEKEKVNDRVHFVGGLGDEEFIRALYCCDFAVLPYLEVNQGGSGIASLVIETGIKSLFANNFAFAELKRYFPDCFESFDIGNYHELAYKLMNYHYDYHENINHCLETYNIENNILFHKSLFDKADEEKHAE